MSRWKYDEHLAQARYEKVEKEYYSYHKFKSGIDMYILGKILNGKFYLRQKAKMFVIPIRNFVFSDKHADFIEDVATSLFHRYEHEKTSPMEHDVYYYADSPFIEYMKDIHYRCQEEGGYTDADSLPQSVLDEAIQKVASIYWVNKRSELALKHYYKMKRGSLDGYCNGRGLYPNVVRPDCGSSSNP